MIKFKRGRSFADSTSEWYVYLDKIYSVDEFIKTVFKDRSNEWGTIDIINIIENCKYSKGKLLDDKLTPEILSKTIKSVGGYGDWSNMDYVIRVKGE